MTEVPHPRAGVAWLTLHSGGRVVTFPAGTIRQILPHAGVVPVPLTRAGIVGVIVQDGRAIPVYSLSRLLGAAAGGDHEAGTEAHIVVVEREGALAGLLAERAEPRRGRPLEGQDIVDGVALLAEASLFEGPGDDGDAAEAAGGAR